VQKQAKMIRYRIDFSSADSPNRSDDWVLDTVRQAETGRMAAWGGYFQILRSFRGRRRKSAAAPIIARVVAEGSGIVPN
jgi:hypothetical protein